MRKFPYEFGFIGMGNMGYAILKGLLEEFPRESAVFSARNREKMENVSARLGVAAAADNRSCAADSHFVILAVKPQQFDNVIGELRDVVTEEQVVISIAPGISIADLKERFGKEIRAVRAMPNTPALVGEGMSGVCYDASVFSREEEEILRRFFSSFGRMEVVEEKLMDAVVCASGSSPAFIYMVIEALADGAVKYGLPRQTAYRMVAQSVLGSAKMVLETGTHPAVLKDQVCSPGGTTISGVAALERFGLRNALIQAEDACYEICKRMK